MVNNNANRALSQATTLSLFDQCASRAVGTFCSGLSVVVLAPLAQKLLAGALATQVANPTVCAVVATTAIGAFAPSGLNAAHQAGQALWGWTKWTAAQSCSYAGLWNRAAAQQNAAPVQVQEIELDEVEEDAVLVNKPLADAVENLRDQAEEAAEELDAALEEATDLNDEVRKLFNEEHNE